MNDTVILALGDDSLCADMKYALREMGISSREFSHGPQAIKEVATILPNLVIVDDMLPYLNGYQFCRLLKFGLHLSVPIILVISSQQRMDRFWGTSSGADYCLSKPVHSQELKAMVQEILGGKGGRRSFFQPPLVGRHTTDLDILKMANDLLDRHLFQEKLLNELKSMDRQVESVPDLICVMMSILGSLFSFRSAVVFLYYETRASFLVSIRERIGQARLDSLYAYLLVYLREQEVLDLSLDEIPITILGPAETDTQAPLEDLADSDISIFRGESLRSVLCSVAFDGLNIEAFPEEEARIFHLILRQALETIEERIIFEKSIPFSIIDMVSRETNRSFFLKILSQNMEQARKFQIPLALVILEIENYAQLVAAFGKKSGLSFQQSIHKTLLNAVRKMDVVARIDQSRFALVLFKANPEQARTVYQRVKILLEELAWTDSPFIIHGGFCPYDPSFGVKAEEFLLSACGQIFPRPQVPTGEEYTGEEETAMSMVSSQTGISQADTKIAA